MPLSTPDDSMLQVGFLPVIGPAPAPVDVPAVAERIAVGFAGEGSGVAELSWGMWEIWQAMESQNTSLPIGGRAPLPEAATVADVAEELGYLLTRFPSMRTRLRFDDTGRPCQELFAAGTIVLEVYDAEDGEDGADADPDGVARAIEDLYRRTPFDYTGAWPVRMAVVRRHGRPTHQITIMNHLVTDAFGALAMLRDVRSRDTAPTTRLEPLDQARWQQSPAGRRQNDRVLRHWEGLLRAVPARRLPDSTDPRTPRHWSADVRSPALCAAVPVIAARTGADRSAVLLTLFAVALNRITAVNPVVVRPVVHNRFRPGLADVVCMAAQAGICSIDVEDVTVDEAVERTRRASMSAYKYGYFHPGDTRDLVMRLSEERGEEFDVACFFNDRSSALHFPDGAVSLTPDELDQALRKARGETTFAWSAQRDEPIERLFFNIVDLPDAARFEIHADTHYLSPSDIEALARGLEEVAVTAALDRATRT